MPELPEVQALANFLADRAVGTAVRRVDVCAFSVLKTAVPPISELVGQQVEDVSRAGKHLIIRCGGLRLVIHLSRAGWLRWTHGMPDRPPKPGKGPLALRVGCGGEGEGFELTEAGTQKRLAVWVVRDEAEVPSVAKLGPDALALDEAGLAEVLAGTTARIKNVLIDQHLIAGIGNAYSDEILHTAKLSPFSPANKTDVPRLHRALRQVLVEATERAVGQEAALLKAEKREGLRVHGRTGEPCPVCGDAIREVSFADRSWQYCPTCQTGGQVLADRRMSRLLK
ncbi:MAG: Fpg/Nei family DNA glycosylase [Segniliparus sp.]|uniref:Fpg/Nei family DNA glycosylase n=1 Tax=Segniliparus sp. TaxID=2804064 RepID=UPI003F3FF5EC